MIRHSRPILLVSFALVLLVPSPDAAQAQSPAPAPLVAVGDRVRLSTRDFPRYTTLLFAGRTGDTLYFGTGAAPDTWWVLARNVRDLRHRGRPRTVGRGALVGMRNGIAIGAAAGAVAGLFFKTCTACEDPITRPQFMLIFGVVGAGVGAPLGLLAGMASPGHVWQQVDPLDGERFAPRPVAAPAAP